MVKTYGIKINAYHADNLWFNDVNYNASCLKAGHRLSFCGIGAHQQNVIAEQMIQEIYYDGRTSILHAKMK